MSESGEGKRGASSGKKRAAKHGSITWRRSAKTHCGAVTSPIQMRRMKASGADPESGTDSLPRFGVMTYRLGAGPKGWAKNRANVSRSCSGFSGID